MTYYRDLGDGDKIVNERFKIVDKVRNCKDIFEQLEDTLSISWELMFPYAKRYFEERGDLEAPKRYKTDEGYSLGNWIITQCKVYSGEQFGRLSEDQINRLNKIGMRWGSLKDVGKKICQIRSYRKSGMKNSYVTAERIKRLEDIRIKWA